MKNGKEKEREKRRSPKYTLLATTLRKRRRKSNEKRDNEKDKKIKRRTGSVRVGGESCLLALRGMDAPEDEYAKNRRHEDN